MMSLKHGNLLELDLYRGPRYIKGLTKKRAPALHSTLGEHAVCFSKMFSIITMGAMNSQVDLQATRSLSRPVPAVFAWKSKANRDISSEA